MKQEWLEQVALTWFQDSGWEYRHALDIGPDGDTPEHEDYRHVLLPDRLREALNGLNSGVRDSVLDGVLHQLAKPGYPSLILNNRGFREALLDGVPVEVEIGGVKCGDRVGDSGRFVSPIGVWRDTSDNISNP